MLTKRKECRRRGSTKRFYFSLIFVSIYLSSFDICAFNFPISFSLALEAFP